MDRTAWASVRGRLGLSAEAKLVWEEIWHKADRRPQTLQCHPAAVGSLFGAEDPLRSGKRSLKALAGIGLIELVECGRGQWVFFVNDPIEVELQRLRKVSDSGQRELFEEPEVAEPEEIAVIALQNLSRGQAQPGTQLPPPGVAIIGDAGPANLSRGQPLAGTQQTGGDCATTAGLEANRQPPPVFSAVVAQSPPISTSASKTSEVSKSTSNLNLPTSEVQKPTTGGGCATTADPRDFDRPAIAEAGFTETEAARVAAGQRAEKQGQGRGKEPAPVGGAIGLILQRVEARAAAQSGDAKALARYIFERVADPKLMRCVCDRIAWAIVRGEYPREKLEGVLTQADKLRAGGRRDVWVFFVGVMKKSFREHGAGELTKRGESNASAAAQH